jgi:hypothetical protein
MIRPLTPRQSDRLIEQTLLDMEQWTAAYHKGIDTFCRAWLHLADELADEVSQYPWEATHITTDERWHDDPFFSAPDPPPPPPGAGPRTIIIRLTTQPDSKKKQAEKQADDPPRDPIGLIEI